MTLECTQNNPGQITHFNWSVKGLWISKILPSLSRIGELLFFGQVEVQVLIESNQESRSRLPTGIEMNGSLLSFRFTLVPPISPNLAKFPSPSYPPFGCSAALNSIFWTWLFRASISFYIVFLIWHFQRQTGLCNSKTPQHVFFIKKTEIYKRMILFFAGAWS